jgi:hypothetical protein
VAWADDSRYRPLYTIVHYGGSTNLAGGDEVGLPPYSFAQECSSIRGWEAYHTGSKGMRAIAYNWVGGQTGHLFWGRGPQHANGGQWGYQTDPEGHPLNYSSRAYAFLLGGAQVPSLEARRTFGRLWLEEPLGSINEVHCHRDYYDTACPGAFLIGWVQRRGWLYDLGVWKRGSKGATVTSIRVALHRKGFHGERVSNEKFGWRLERRVKRFQRSVGLPVDGIVGHDTFEALGRP